MRNGVLACVALVTAAACSGKASKGSATPTVVTKSKAAISRPKSDCVAVNETENRIVPATANADEVGFCVSGGVKSVCYSGNPDNGAIKRVDKFPKSQVPALSPSTAQVNPLEKSVEACLGDAKCKPLKYKVKASAPPQSVAISQSGGTVAIAAGDAKAGKGTVELWDVAGNKRIANLKYANGDFRCATIRFLGETLAVSADNCNGPSARGALYSKAGKRLADIGSSEFGTFGFSYTQVDLSVWAFLEESAGQVVLQDVESGAIVKKFDLSSMWAANKPKLSADKSGSADTVVAEAAAATIGQPGESVVLRGGPGKLVVVAGGPSPGSFAVINVDSGKLSVYRATACKAVK
jgi:hypothetical protein